MVKLFQEVVARGISAGWLVLAILVLRLLLHRGPKWVCPLLWGLVGVRLVMPFSIKSPLSLLPRTAPTLGAAAMQPEPVLIPAPALAPVVPQSGNTIVPQMQSVESAVSSGWEFAALVWLLGVGVLLSYALVAYCLLRFRLRTAVRLQENIYETEQLGAPFVVGVFQPRIYLPFDLAEEEQYYVLLHERAHLHRRDHWWKPIGFLLLTIYWCNPLLWLAYTLLCRDIELACDERAIRELDREQRVDYSQSLLNCSVPRRQLTVCPLAFGEVGVKERVKNVLNYKKPAFWVVLTAVAACVLAAVCFLTDPKPYQAVILSGGQLYYETELSFQQLPEGAEAIGALKSTTHRDRGTPTEELSGVNLDETYSGCTLYQCPDAPATIYLEDSNGAYLPFQADENSRWFDGIVYHDLAPGQEVLAERDLFLLADDTDVLFQTTYGFSEMEVEFGLRGRDGKEYAATAKGGSTRTVVRGVPAGSYQLFVRNGSDIVSGPQNVGVLKFLPVKPAAWVTHREQGIVGNAEKWGDRWTEPDEGDAGGERTMPEFPGVIFQWTEYAVIARDWQGKTTTLYEGMPVWSVYFADLNGDGKREICSTVSYGHGIIDERIEVYDYAAGKLYELSDRGKRDYILWDRGGLLMVDERDHESGTALSESAIRLENGRLVLQQASTVTDDGPISSLLDTICSSPLEASSTAAYIGEHQAEYRQLVGMGQDTLAYCFREFLTGRGQGLRGSVMEYACQEILLAWGMKQEEVECSYGGAEEWFYLMAYYANNARLECTPQELKELHPAWYLLLEAAEGEVRDLSQYQIIYGDFEECWNMPLDQLCVYAVYSDGAFAESASGVLYERFMEKPEETLEHISTLLDWSIPCRGTAASNVCNLIVFDGYYFDTVQPGQTPFWDTLKKLREKYSEGKMATVLDLLENEYHRSEMQETIDAAEYQEWMERQA